MSVEAFKGSIIESLRTLPVCPDTAPMVHGACIWALLRDGFTVIPEYVVQMYDGRSGRIDIVVKDGRYTAGIEIDARKPRKKSIAKLNVLGGLRISVLRGVSYDGWHPELDAIVGLNVRIPKADEIGDKAFLSRMIAAARRNSL